MQVFPLVSTPDDESRVMDMSPFVAI